MLGLLIFSTFSQSGLAAVPCLPREQVDGGLIATNSMILKASQVDDADRRIAKDYANGIGDSESAVKIRYAATGDLFCDGQSGQANLTIKDDIITTAAHVISPNCVSDKKPPKCKVVFEIEGEKKTYDIESVKSTGWTCDINGRLHSTGTDWAVLKLKGHADERIKPYKVAPKSFVDRMTIDDPVTFVAKSPDFPDDGKFKSLAERPRHYGDCQAKERANFDFSVIRRLNCDMSPGSSGGALVTRGKDPLLVGVGEATGPLTTAKCPKMPKVGIYSKCFGSAATIVTSDFRAALDAISSN